MVWLEGPQFCAEGTVIDRGEGESQYLLYMNWRENIYILFGLGYNGIILWGFG